MKKKLMAIIIAMLDWVRQDETHIDHVRFVAYKDWSIAQLIGIVTAFAVMLLLIVALAADLAWIAWMAIEALI